MVGQMHKESVWLTSWMIESKLMFIKTIDWKRAYKNKLYIADEIKKITMRVDENKVMQVITIIHLCVEISMH